MTSFMIVPAEFVYRTMIPAPTTAESGLMSPKDIVNLEQARLWAHSVALHAKQLQDMAGTLLVDSRFALKTFNHIDRHGNEVEGCYRLRHRPIELQATATSFARDGAITEKKEWHDAQSVRRDMKMKLGKKQKAAKQKVPVNTIQVVPVKPVRDADIVVAELKDQTVAEVKISRMTKQLELMIAQYQALKAKAEQNK